MDAREYRDFLSDEKAIIRLAIHEDDGGVFRVKAIVIDEEECIAVTVQNTVRDPNEGGIPAGAIVKFARNHEADGAEPRMIGTPAFACTVAWKGREFS